jgi:tRNA A37 threonylcarbamoyladenosine synthetase subunit TsaC/SUA5/YrdC
MPSSTSVPVPPTPPAIQISPQLVSAAYKRALRYGAYWRLRPEERAILLLARRLRAIKSPALREAILKILEKVWPSEATMIKAYEEGLKILARKIQLALAIGAIQVAEALRRATHGIVLALGYSYQNTPLFYRG